MVSHGEGLVRSLIALQARSERVAVDVGLRLQCHSVCGGDVFEGDSCNSRVLCRSSTS